MIYVSGFAIIGIFDFVCFYWTELYSYLYRYNVFCKLFIEIKDKIIENQHKYQAYIIGAHPTAWSVRRLRIKQYYLMHFCICYILRKVQHLSTCVGVPKLISISNSVGTAVLVKWQRTFYIDKMKSTFLLSILLFGIVMSNEIDNEVSYLSYLYYCMKVKLCTHFTAYCIYGAGWNCV